MRSRSIVDVVRVTASMTPRRRGLFSEQHSATSEGLERPGWFTTHLPFQRGRALEQPGWRAGASLPMQSGRVVNLL